MLSDVPDSSSIQALVLPNSSSSNLMNFSNPSNSIDSNIKSSTDKKEEKRILITRTMKRMG